MSAPLSTPLDTLILPAHGGLRFVDACSRLPVIDGLRCSLRRRGDGRLLGIATRTPSGIHHWPALAVDWLDPAVSPPAPSASGFAEVLVEDMLDEYSASTRSRPERQRDRRSPANRRPARSDGFRTKCSGGRSRRIPHCRLQRRHRRPAGAKQNVSCADLRRPRPSARCSAVHCRPSRSNWRSTTSRPELRTQRDRSAPSAR